MKTHDAYIKQEGCIFCFPPEEKIVEVFTNWVFLWDSYPVTEGHMLVVPKWHRERVVGLTWGEMTDMGNMIYIAQDIIKKKYKADAFTVGINDGSAAGQTVHHLHIHVIPRVTGDVPDPRGGVRWVIPERADYWSPSGS